MLFIILYFLRTPIKAITSRLWMNLEVTSKTICKYIVIVVSCIFCIFKNLKQRSCFKINEDVQKWIYFFLCKCKVFFMNKQLCQSVLKAIKIKLKTFSFYIFSHITKFLLKKALYWIIWMYFLYLIDFKCWIISLYFYIPFYTSMLKI